MTKHAYSEKETLWMRLKLPKFGFLSSLPKLEPNSCRDVGDELRKRRDMRVPML